MAGTLLHFGQDLHGRVSVLRGAGYEVMECRSMIQLRSVIHAGASADAVVLTEGFHPEDEIAVTRAQSPLPFILFEDHSVPNLDFDLVIPPRTPAVQWLDSVGDVIARNRALRARSEEIRAKSETLIRQATATIGRTQYELERSRRERARDIPQIIGGWAGTAFDENTTGPAAPCPERNELDMSILISLAHLTHILHAMIGAGLESGPESHPLEDMRIEHDLECANLESLLVQWKAHKNRHRC